VKKGVAVERRREREVMVRFLPPGKMCLPSNLNHGLNFLGLFGLIGLAQSLKSGSEAR
jgi:hypothetical protein